MNNKKKRIPEMMWAALVLPTLIALVFLYGWVSGRIQDLNMRNEIVEYVLENKDSIIPNDFNKNKEFIFSSEGLPTAYVEYGYYYSPDDTYWSGGYEYRNGYRIDGSAHESFDWYYVERICENWFYYEFHDG